MGLIGLAMMLASLTSSAEARQDSCVVAGRVLSAGRPVPGVDVSLTKIDRSAVSDSSGRFRIANVPCVRHDIGFRKIGFTVLHDTATAAGTPDSARYYPLIAVAQLDTVRTT